ncbi:MAG: glucokinase [Cyanobacteria bacterium NC_groundwater_1444_Ag_S-0.65um_54_12]|nr:glucokinase [Cyanobacteria bacterium NC_groundwater_1444_Ag_S-0.65um_54_12]
MHRTSQSCQPPVILSGDVGGTKTLLALRSGEQLLAEKRYASRDYGDLVELVRDFFANVGLAPQRAVFGVAGPVKAGCSKATNLPWEISAERLQKELAIPIVQLINDFAAVAHGLRALGPQDLVPLNDTVPQPGGTVVVLGAGTGLGEGFLVSCDGKEIYVASEGGHADFAPRNEQEIALLRYILRSRRRASVERLVSGPGIVTIYNFLSESSLKSSQATLPEHAATGDLPALVTRHALAGDCALCVETMELFLRLYGAEAGNLALKALPTGGVYVAGGIAPKISDLLRNGTFLSAYGDKGRMSELVKSFPVQVVINPQVGLLGAHLVASRL